MFPETEMVNDQSQVTRDKNSSLITRHPSLSIIEATLSSGALVESPSNGGPTGRKWRVRIFEYGLSKNRYPDPGLPSFGSRETLQESALALYQSAQQSAQRPAACPSVLGFGARSYPQFSWRQRGKATKFFRFFRIYRGQSEPRA